MGKLMHRSLAYPNHPLLGQVVEVRGVAYQNEDVTPRDIGEPMEPNELELRYADGRIFTITACGYEADGLSITVGERKD